jgi:hypothetical protein
MFVIKRSKPSAPAVSPDEWNKERQSRPGAVFHTKRLSLGLLLLIAGGALVRSLRLTWQPLWWDEGYSVYFATESLGRMVWLTAHDIHPPLYYAILHGWLVISRTPLWARGLSVIIAAASLAVFAWLAGQLFPDRRRLRWIALLLLAVNPFHLFYSQEIRMYGLALTLGMLTTLFAWRSVEKLKEARAAYGDLACYLLVSLLALHTLYYLAFLLLAQALWAWQQLWRKRPALFVFNAVLLASALGYLPWLLYTAPKFIAYVNAKVVADQDHPLSIGDFLWRHLTTMVNGHAPGASGWAYWLQAASTGAAIFSFFFALRSKQSSHINHANHPKEHESNALSQSWRRASTALWVFTLVPALCAFAVNQVRPFFPENGERLLLFVLPYFVLLLAAGIDQGLGRAVARPRWTAALLGVSVAVGSLAGVLRFYVTPRHSAGDYRPIVRQIAQQSAPNDTILATYPWQVGFWRAYNPLPSESGPSVTLLSEGEVIWSEALQRTVDQASAQGTLWIPQLLSVGSMLPDKLDAYLAQRGAYSLEYRWYGPETRLEGWRAAVNLSLTDTDLDFGAIQFNGVSVTPQSLPSANAPLLVDLRWVTRAPNSAYSVSLRLQDNAGRSWVQQDRQLGVVWVYDRQGFRQRLGMIVPPGLPPGAYRLMLGVSRLAEKQALKLTVEGGRQAEWVSIADITVTQPAAPVAVQRLPMQTSLAKAQISNGIALLGYDMPLTPVLVGDRLRFTLFFQNRAATLSPRQLTLSLVDKANNPVFEWSGWPLPDYPTNRWPEQALVQTPIEFDLPATLNSGRYRLRLRWVDKTNDQSGAALPAGEVTLQQRQANFTPSLPPWPLQPPPLLGSHVYLHGCEITANGQDVDVQLYWQVEQPLLPPHHIFIHIDDAAGASLGQSDGAPQNADGPAPTGSWQPGEYLVTVQRIALAQDAQGLLSKASIRVGLYDPTTEARLPVSVNGNVTGDSVACAAGGK